MLVVVPTFFSRQFVLDVQANRVARFDAEVRAGNFAFVVRERSQVWSIRLRAKHTQMLVSSIRRLSAAFRRAIGPQASTRLEGQRRRRPPRDPHHVLEIVDDRLIRGNLLRY